MANEERSVVVRMRAEFGSYLGGLKTAAAETRALASTTGTFTRQQEIGLQKVGFAAGAMGAALAGGVALAVSRFAEFDKALSGVRAVADATSGQMDRLRTAAIDAGQATIFSASDAAKAEAELAKAGVQVGDILGGGLRGALDLAAAGQIDLAQSATIAAQAMNVFDKSGRDVSHIADVLAAGANKSAADVGQLGDALRQGGLVAAQTGLSLEETVGQLSAFADNALIGSDAGTALKTAMQRLVPQSAEAADAMESIGFSAFDAQGKFVGLESVAQQLKKGLTGLSDEQRQTALTTIFGSDAVRAANILYEEGARGVADYTKAVNDFGAAQRMAAIQLDNLSGDLEQLKGSIDTALIQSGSGANGALRALTQTATGAVNSFSALPGPVQGSFTAMSAFAGGTFLAVGAVGTLAPKVRETREALEKMGSAGIFASKSLGTLGKLTVAGAVLISLATAADAVSRKMRELEGTASPAVDDLTRSLLRFEKTGKVSGAGLKGIGEDASQLVKDLNKSDSGLSRFNSSLAKFSSFGLGTTGLTEAKNRIDALDDSLTSLVSQGYRDKAADIFLKIVQTGKLSADQVHELRGRLDEYTAATDQAETASELAAGSTDEFGNSVASVTGELGDADEALKQWMDDLSEMAGSFIEPIDAYKSLLDEKETAERQSAEDTAAATKSGSDSWEDYARDVKVSIDDVNDKLQEQLKAQRDWKENLLTLAARGVPREVLETLESKGTDAAPLIAKLADASEKELKRFVRLTRHDSELAVQGIAEVLIDAQPVLARVAEQSGEKVAEGYARKLAAGKITVEQISQDYGWALTSNIPSEVKTHVSIVGVDRAKSDAREIFEYLSNLPRTINVKIGVGRFAGKELPVDAARAGGGEIPSAWGGPRQDNVLGYTPTGHAIAMSGGEFIVNAAAYQRNRMLVEAINSGQRFAGGGWVSAQRIPTGGPTRQLVSETRTHEAPVIVEHMEVADYDDFRRQEDQARRLHSLPGNLGG